MISVVCPFYNEEAILERSVTGMLENLAHLDDAWELIIVNDGSTDGSGEIAQRLATHHQPLRIEGYDNNRGRGFAIRKGISTARGELVVTTEIDSSWGDQIVAQIIAVFAENPDADMVVASPNLPGGGYRNVPLRRVLLSRVGNLVIRAGQNTKLSMYTGMTRGYRRQKFLELPLEENEKEFHLEVARKAQALGFRIYEIPAVLEWKAHKLSAPGSAPRRSSSKVGKLMRSHLMFSLMAAPFRYIFPVGGMLLLVGTAFLAWAIYHLFTPTPSIYLLLTSLFLFLFGFLFLAIGVLAHQGISLLQELWRVRSELRQSFLSAPGEE